MATPRKGVSFKNEVSFLKECQETGVESLTSEDEAWTGKYRKRRDGVDERPAFTFSLSTNAVPHTQWTDGDFLHRYQDVSVASGKRPVPSDQVDSFSRRRDSLSPEKSTPSKPAMHRALSFPPKRPELGDPLSRSSSIDSTASSSSLQSIKNAAAKLLSKGTRRRQSQHNEQEKIQDPRSLEEQHHQQQDTDAKLTACKICHCRPPGPRRVRTAEQAEHDARIDAENLSKELSGESIKKSPQDAERTQAWTQYNDRQARLKALRIQREEAKKKAKAASKGTRSNTPNPPPMMRLGILSSPRSSFETGSSRGSVAVS